MEMLSNFPKVKQLISPRPESRHPSSGVILRNITLPYLESQADIKDACTVASSAVAWSFSLFPGPQFAHS